MVVFIPIVLSFQSILVSIYLHHDGISEISKLKLDNITMCIPCLTANQTMRTPVLKAQQWSLHLINTKTSLLIFNYPVEHPTISKAILLLSIYLYIIFTYICLIFLLLELCPHFTMVQLQKHIVHLPHILQLHCLVLHTISVVVDKI